jgi:putative hydrolase of HD superfamily
MDIFPITKIDLNRVENINSFPEHQPYPSSASLALELGGVAIKFAQVERAPRYDNEHKENDAEHSYMLALVANELAATYYPTLDAGKVTQFAIVHDLIETVTGDVTTFQFTPEQMADKQQVEHAALQKLMDSLPTHTAQLLYSYENQQTIEARFVKAVDKLLPVVVDILGAGKKVMQEEYGVSTIAQLKTSHTKLHSRIAQSFAEFPLIVTAHESLCRLFQEEFEVAAIRLQ